MEKQFEKPLESMNAKEAFATYPTLRADVEKMIAAHPERKFDVGRLTLRIKAGVVWVELPFEREGVR
jgi:hypothetical protein